MRLQRAIAFLFANVLAIGLVSGASAEMSTVNRAESELKKALGLIIRFATPSVSPIVRDKLVRDYVAAEENKAQAVNLAGPDFWRATLHDTAASAGERTLEGCQMRYNKPCALIAINEQITPDGELVAKDMPRIAYTGTFDLDQIPAIRKSTRGRADIQNYSNAMEPKAIAIHPYGLLHTSTGKATQREAEEAALDKCNRDIRIATYDGPCFLYAINNDVVLPKRLREAR